MVCWLCLFFVSVDQLVELLVACFLVYWLLALVASSTRLPFCAGKPILKFRLRFLSACGILNTLPPFDVELLYDLTQLL